MAWNLNLLKQWRLMINVFINVMVDRAEHVYPMLIAGQSMKDMWLGKRGRTAWTHYLCTLENEAGALSRLVGLFSQRGFTTLRL